MDRGRLFVISGPSGAGKGTICNRVLAQKSDLTVSVSMTTRQRREGEIQGQNYFFVTEEEFLKVQQKGGFLESACVYGNYYGTPKDKVLDTLAQGRDVVLEIDIQGAMAVKESYPKAIFIFILPPSLSELSARIRGRATDSKETIDLRLGQAMMEISQVGKYDYCVINGDLEGAASIVKSIILAEHSKISGNAQRIIEKYKEEL